MSAVLDDMTTNRSMSADVNDIDVGDEHSIAHLSFTGDEHSTANVSFTGDDSLAPATHQTPPICIPFFRWFGPTGIAPGYKRFFVHIKDSSETQALHQSATSAHPADDAEACSSPASTQANLHLFEPDKLTPSSDVLFPLLHTFFEYYSCHFPWHTQDHFIASVREKKVPAILLNSMCAMAARFSTLPVFDGQPASLRGEVFVNKAKHLLIPLLNLPSYEVVESILMISWLELANCHDVGIWMYTGMAVRMAEDMGLHKDNRHSDDLDRTHSSLLYWAINLLDHIICFAVGRPLTTRREYITVDLPQAFMVQSEPFELASPFPDLIGIIQIQGLVNELVGQLPEHAAGLTSEIRRDLISLGNKVAAQYTSMHSSLVFNVPNLRAHAVKGQGGTFLLLHLWFNSVWLSCDVTLRVYD